MHGSAHDIAGTGAANPVAAIRSAGMMLEFLGESDAAERITKAVSEWLADPDPTLSDERHRRPHRRKGVTTMPITARS